MLTNRKILLFISSVLLLFYILAGCSSNNGSRSTHSKEVTLTLLIDNQADQDGIRAVAANIEKKYHIKTEIETRPSGVEGHQVMKTRLATGDMADLVMYNSGSLLYALNPEEYFVDLTNEPFMDNILDSFKESVSINGKVFGVPMGGAIAGGWLYNKKVYRELGLTIPRTWDELIANNEKIKAAGKTAVIGTYKDDWTSQLIVVADNHNVISEDPTFAVDFTVHKSKFATTPAALKSFEKLAEVYQKGFLNQDFQTATYEDGMKMLVDGTGVHYPSLSWVLMAIATNYPDKIKDIGFFPQPGDTPGKNGMTVFMPAAVYVNKNIEHLDAVKKWLDYFVSSEGVETFLADRSPIGPLAIKGIKFPTNTIPAIKDMLPYFDEGKATPALEYLSPLKGPRLPQITIQVGSGQISAKTGAELYDKDVEKQAKQLGLKGW
ncbi:carbohydrate ABC transporter substrate-binding protein [Bacillus sp. ISL-40]|uniref:ABC transporter substrate-binding protein n=1 Tax=unclassified Bacillus (in: firmicutes) TaxID=185979 RepID=UPI001BE59BAF|nr:MULTISPECIES: ABC transporter substrate-binding protein [unclassified Bacillus (in: firmicutes)]MBT2700459.1 carbohydrate ABC transporter substrate-binding protein [Bacillus sp. ISL-40]MBT2720486.1 carbohydrate ABC transporter substrate-binding protein [Bacillus sp. ISL-46]MBT2744236.1 carbohydrate ABC transporter substrate-binding protein [Bacillus sp. ISL-77]